MKACHLQCLCFFMAFEKYATHIYMYTSKQDIENKNKNRWFCDDE